YATNSQSVRQRSLCYEAIGPRWAGELVDKPPLATAPDEVLATPRMMLPSRVGWWLITALPDLRIPQLTQASGPNARYMQGGCFQHRSTNKSVDRFSSSLHQRSVVDHGAQRRHLALAMRTFGEYW